MQNNYDIFSGEDLKIADLIQRRRLQILIHSCIYYEKDSNIINDKQWDTWARELVKLQSDYPEIASKVAHADAFKDWDASTGAFLPLKDKSLVGRANCLLRYNAQVSDTVKVTKVPQPAKQVAKQKQKAVSSFRLF